MLKLNQIEFWYTYEILRNRYPCSNFYRRYDFWTSIPLDVIEKIRVRLENEVNHVSRVLYDVTSKPPATIEWE